MTDRPSHLPDQRDAETYQICVRGHLDAGWAARLDVPRLTHRPDGTTMLHDVAADQAALHGLLQRLRDLGLTLVAVVRIEPATSLPIHLPLQPKETRMKITNESLIRAAGPAASVAGLAYALVGVFHPPNILASVTTPAWLAVHVLAMGMSVFGLLGLTGIYARQAEKSGWVGLAGYLLLNLWLAAILGFTFVEVFILPALATIAPSFVEAWLGMFNGTANAIDLGPLNTLWTISGLLYILGGILFGIATFRARILPRWAAVLLAAGTAMGPLAALLPLDLQPKIAIPVGLALAWLGYSLWSERRARAARSLPEFRPASAA